MNQTYKLINLINRASTEDVFNFLQKCHRRPFLSVDKALRFNGVIDDEIEFLEGTITKYRVTPLMIAVGKGFYDKVKLLLVHGANPNRQCATGDTALNIAAHRQHSKIVHLLLSYRANPNLSNQAGKTALHRAVVSYKNEDVQSLKDLLEAKAQTLIPDRNGRTPLDDAVLHDRIETVEFLLSADKKLAERAVRSALIGARLGHDQCLEILLNNGMNPNISDEHLTTPLQVAVVSSRLPTAKLLMSRGADPLRKNSSSENAISLAEKLPIEKKIDFLRILRASNKENFSDGSQRKKMAPFDEKFTLFYPLLRNQLNWTLNNSKYRSETSFDSNVENLLDLSSERCWCSLKSTNAWVIFDFKHQHEISGIRLTGCDDPESIKEARLEISTSVRGPWLPIGKIESSSTMKRIQDFTFSPVQTRFVRLFILKNHAGPLIQVQAVQFFGINLRLIEFLKEHRLEKYLRTLLANGINDLETLEERRHEILDSSESLYNLDDHFRFSKLLDTLKTPELTFLEWLDFPQASGSVGFPFGTFSVRGDEGVTDRVVLEELAEQSYEPRVVAIKDLEPTQNSAIADFSDYIIEQSGRYQIRVVSYNSPQIQTAWWPIVIGELSF